MQHSREPSTPRTVDQYLRGLPPAARTALTRLRRTIRAAAPKAEETISWSMPAYKLKGVLVFFAAFEKHCSFFPGSKSILRKFSEDLKPFDASGATIRFTPDHPIPAALVRRIIKARIKENEERYALRSLRRSRAARR